MGQPAMAVQGAQPREGGPGVMPPDPALGAGAVRLAGAVARAEKRKRRQVGGSLACSLFRAGSWRAQRIMHRSPSRWRMLVSGRGVGKTHGCAYELIQIVMDAPPGSMGAVLAPTLFHAEAARDKLRQLAAPLGVDDSDWVSTKRELRLPGGRLIKIFSADRKEVVRGPSIVALWIDEGAYMSYKAVESSLPAMRAPGVVVRLLISSTPAGKDWLWSWWEKGGKGDLDVERFRFKGTDSPYNDPGTIELYRQTASPEKFAQEYLAEFVDNLLLAFPDRDGLFVDEHHARSKAARCWLGVDIGQSDFTVCILMNEWGEGEVVGRWNEETPGFSPATYSTQTIDRVIELAKKHKATLVIDTGGAGPSLGSVVATKARENGIEVIEIKTSSQGTKGKVVEQARADVQWKKVTIRRNDYSGALDYELSKFQAIKRIHHGQELMIYEGPQVRGEHDDCVISFCLANWGRVHGEKQADPCGGDWDGFAGDVSGGAPSPGGEFGDWSPLG